MLERGPSEESGEWGREAPTTRTFFLILFFVTRTRVPLERWGKRKEGKPPPFAPLLINIRVYPRTFAANSVIDEFAARLFAHRKTAERV